MAQLCRLHEARVLPNARSKCRRVNCCNSGRAGSQPWAASSQAGSGGLGRPVHPRLRSLRRGRGARLGRPPHGGANSGVDLNFPGTRRRAALTLLNTSRSSSSSSRSSTSACRAEELMLPERGRHPRALPAGAPSREAPGARLARPALALHPESARRSGRRRQPGFPSLPIGSCASLPPRAGPAPAPCPLRRRGTGS